jgi:hypothetical protein
MENQPGRSRLRKLLAAFDYIRQNHRLFWQFVRGPAVWIQPTPYVVLHLLDDPRSVIRVQNLTDSRGNWAAIQTNLAIFVIDNQNLNHLSPQSG